MRTQIATLQEFGTRSTIVVHVGEKPVLLVRTGKEIHATSAFCPHRGAPLTDGYVIENMIVCPWHRSMFNLCSGQLVNGVSPQALETFPVIVENGAVYVELED